MVVADLARSIDSTGEERIEVGIVGLEDRVDPAMEALPTELIPPEEDILGRPSLQGPLNSFPHGIILITNNICIG